MKDTNWVYVYGFARNIILGLLYCFAIIYKDNYVMGSVYMSAALLTIMAVSNGHFTTLMFSIGSNRVDDKYKGGAGFICVAGLLTGLMYGSMVSHFSLNS